MVHMCKSIKSKIHSNKHISRYVRRQISEIDKRTMIPHPLERPLMDWPDQLLGYVERPGQKPSNIPPQGDNYYIVLSCPEYPEPNVMVYHHHYRHIKTGVWIKLLSKSDPVLDSSVLWTTLPGEKNQLLEEKLQILLRDL